VLVFRSRSLTKALGLSWARFILIGLVPLTTAVVSLPAAETLSAGELRGAASAAIERGQYSNAVELATQAIAAEPDNFRAWAMRLSGSISIPISSVTSPIESPRP